MSNLNKQVTVKLVDTTDNTAVEYKTTTEPKKSTLGNSYFGTINSKGLAKLQKAGYTINCEDDWCNLLRATFKLTAEELGSRGPAWKDQEARNRYKVYIDGVEFNPEFTAAQIKANGVNSVPKVVIAQSNASSAVPLPPRPVEATADTTVMMSMPPPPPPQPTMATPLPPQPVIATPIPPIVAKQELTAQERGFVNSLVNYKREGKFSKEQLIAELGKVVGMERAKELYEYAL